MRPTRRDLALSAPAALATLASFEPVSAEPGTPMYGLISQLTAHPGRREELARILLSAATGMPGCLSYVVAADSAQEDALWITEVWRDRASHAASLSLPQVQAAIARGRPLIAGSAIHVQTVPLGGAGLSAG
jgi:quinol monooxygenase YgiN